MTRAEVKEIFKLISFNYPQFEVSPEKLDYWLKLLQSDDPGIVKKNVERHTLESKFPPTIADIREMKHPSYEADDILEKIKKWESEASGKR